MEKRVKTKGTDGKDTPILINEDNFKDALRKLVSAEPIKLKDVKIDKNKPASIIPPHW